MEEQYSSNTENSNLPFQFETLMSPFYPCIKYKIPADQKLEGSDHFIVAESMHLKSLSRDSIRKKRSRPANDIQTFDCSLSFTCENDQKAFYKLTKDCSNSGSISILKRIIDILYLGDVLFLECFP